MQLAADPIVIEIAGEAYELRPTLLAALRLCRKAGNYSKLYKAILADHVSIVTDVIREGSGSLQAAADFLHGIDDVGVRRTVDPIKLPLLRFVLQLAGDDDDNAQAKPATGKLIPFDQFYSDLFSIGTGWLGWTPEDTWDATPAEILAAQRGRIGMISDVIKSVFGSSESDAPETTPVPLKLRDDGTDATFDRDRLHSLKGKLAS